MNRIFLSHTFHDDLQVSHVYYIIEEGRKGTFVKEQQGVEKMMGYTMHKAHLLSLIKIIDKVYRKTFGQTHVHVVTDSKRLYDILSKQSAETEDTRLANFEKILKKNTTYFSSFSCELVDRSKNPAQKAKQEIELQLAN